MIACDVSPVAMFKIGWQKKIEKGTYQHIFVSFLIFDYHMKIFIKGKSVREVDRIWQDSLRNPREKTGDGVFVKHVCSDWKIHLSKLLNLFVKSPNKWKLKRFGEEGFIEGNRGCYICPNWKLKLENVFVQIKNCICSNCLIYLSQVQNVFVQIAKCICPNLWGWWKLTRFVEKSSRGTEDVVHFQDKPFATN